jgi:DNA ligase
MKRLLFLCLALCFLPLKTYALESMLPQVYKDNIHVVGWLMSEKLDGVRGYWDGKQLVSKNGSVFHPPAAFTHNFPPFPLEGELWGGRGTFEKTVSIVKKQQSHDGWLTIQFAIFDVPQEPGSFSSRIQNAANWFATHPSRFAFVIPQQMITASGQLRTELQRIEELGGEGLIVRNPDATYTAGRSKDILKVKNFYDMEAVVVDHIPGKGRHQGRLGALLVTLPDNSGIRFRIGSGLSDAERNSPPPIGAIITFKYYGFYESGIPKFPSFMRTRTDISLSH